MRDACISLSDSDCVKFPCSIFARAALPRYSNEAIKGGVGLADFTRCCVMYDVNVGPPAHRHVMCMSWT